MLSYISITIFSSAIYKMYLLKLNKQNLYKEIFHIFCDQKREYLTYDVHHFVYLASHSEILVNKITLYTYYCLL